MADAQILFDLVLSTSSTTSNVEELLDRFQVLSKQIKEVENLGPGLRRSLDTNIRAASGNTRDLASVVQDLNNNLAQTNNALSDTNNEFDKFSNQTQSVDNLKKRLKELKKELEGINPRNRSRIDAITQEMQELENQIEDTNRDLGLLTGGLNTLDSAAKKNSLLNGSLARTTRGFLTSFALFEVITTTTDALRSVITVGAEFERQLSAVGAVANATAAELRALEAESRRLGETTTFTAQQALEAAETLAIAGFSAREIIGAQEGVLRLAEATSVTLEEAADVAAIVLRSFGLEVENIGEVNNVLTNTITTANLRLDSFVEAFKLAGPVAKQVGLDLETTAAAIGTLADAGFRGSVGGTALRASLIRLTRPVGQAKEVFEELQIPLDTLANNGDFVGFLETLIERGATTEQVFGLFGKQSAAISVLIDKLAQDTEGGSNAFRNYALRVGEVGTQVRAALDVLPGLNGNIDDIVNTLGRDIADADGGLLQLPVALEDSAAAIATLNSQFDETEDAIAAFEGLVETIQEAAQDETIQLDVEFDAQGNLENVFTALQEGTNQGIFSTGQQQVVNELFTNIRGNTTELEESLEKLGIQFNDTDTAIEKYQLALNEYNVATDIATDRNDNLTGDFIRLQSALSETAISILDSLSPVLRDLVQGITEVVQEINVAIRAFGSFRDFLVRNERLIRGLTATILAGATAWGLYRAAFISVIAVARAQTFFTALGRGLTLLSGTVTGLTTGTIGLSRAFQLLRTSMLATPLGAVLAGITAITAGVIAFAQETSQAAKALEDFNEATANVGNDFNENLEGIRDQLDELGRFNTTFERRQEILNDLQKEYAGYLDGINLEASTVGELKILYEQLAEAEANRVVDTATEEKVTQYRTEIGVLRRVTEVIGEAAEAQREFDALRGAQQRSSSFSATLSQDVEEARENLRISREEIQTELTDFVRILNESGSDLSEDFEDLLANNLADLQRFSEDQLEIVEDNLQAAQERSAEKVESILREFRETQKRIEDEFGGTIVEIVEEVVTQITDSQINIQDVTQDELERFIRTLRSEGAESITRILQVVTDQEDLTLNEFRESLGTNNVERIFTELERAAEIRIKQLEQTEEAAGKAAETRRKEQERKQEESNRRLDQLIAEADKLIEENDKKTLAGILRIRQRRLDALVGDEAFAELLSTSPERAAALIQGIEREIDTLEESLLQRQQELFERTLEQSLQITADTNESITNDLRQALIEQFNQINTALDNAEIDEQTAQNIRRRTLERFQELTRVNEEGELEIIEEFRNRRLQVEQDTSAILIDFREDQAQQEQQSIFRFVDLKEEELNIVRRIALTREELERSTNEDLQLLLDEREQLYLGEVIRVEQAYKRLIDATEEGSEERRTLLSQQNEALLRIERQYLEELREIREDAGALNFRRVLAIDVNELDGALETIEQFRQELLSDAQQEAEAGLITAEQFAERRIAIERVVQTTIQNVRTQLEENTAAQVKAIQEQALRAKTETSKQLNEIKTEFVQEEEERSGFLQLFDTIFDLANKRRERFELSQQRAVIESERIQLQARRDSIQVQIEGLKRLEKAGKDVTKELLELENQLIGVDKSLTDNAANALRLQAEELKRAAELLENALKGVFEGLSQQFTTELAVIERAIQDIERVSDKRIEAIEREAELREQNIIAIGLEGEAQERANAKSEIIRIRAIEREESARDEQLEKENKKRQKIEQTQARIAAIQQASAAAEQVANSIQLAQESGILAVKSAQSIANAGATAGNPILAVVAIFAMVAALTSAFLAIRNAVRAFSTDVNPDVPDVPTFSEGGLHSGSDASEGGSIKGHRHKSKHKGTWLLAEKDEYINNRESVSMFYPVLKWANDQGLRKRKGLPYQSSLPARFFDDLNNSQINLYPKVPNLTAGSVAQDGGLVGGLGSTNVTKEQREQTAILRDIRDGVEENTRAIDNIKLTLSRSELASLDRQTRIEEQRSLT